MSASPSIIHRVPRLRVKPVCLECLVSNCEHLTNHPPRLSRRELSILEIFRDGMETGIFPTDKEISSALGIANGTLKTYTSTMYSKLKVNGRLNAALWAMKHPEVFQD
jgi:DNA-binding NarL/FixJ family response regulator